MDSGAEGQSDEIIMLLARCAQADGNAFRRLYELESGRLYGVALRITRRPHLADDVLHDAMLQVWRNAAYFNPSYGSARSWLISLVRYRALDALKRTKPEGTGIEIPDTADPDFNPLEQLIATRDEQMLRQCLKTVEERSRQFVVMAFMDGLTHAEVAERTGYPLGTVKSAIRRALVTLRICMDSHS